MSSEHTKTVEQFLVHHLSERVFQEPNYLFWIRTVFAGLPLIGPETDADLERLMQQLLDYHANKENLPDTLPTDIRHEIVRTIGPGVWRNTTPLGKKYRCLNAVADTREEGAKNDNWQYGVVTAFGIINGHNNKDQILIDLIRKEAREQGVDLHEG